MVMACGQTTLDRASQKLARNNGNSKPHVLDGGSEAFRKLNGLPSLSSTSKSTEPDQPGLFESGSEKLAKPKAKAKAKPKAKKESAGSKLEAQIAIQCRAMLPAELQPTRELKFHPTRKWRFDFAWPDQKLALEVEGGMFSTPVSCNHCRKPVQNRLGHRIMAAAGRHSRKAGFDADCEKYNEATLLGWRVLRTTNTGIDDGSAIRQVAAMLKAAAGT